MISLIARADRGEYDRSLEDLIGFIKSRAAAQIPEEQRLPPPLLFAVGEAYLQRLIQGGRYDIARKVCQLAVATRSDPAIKAHFEKRLARLDMVGKPAPEIERKDVNGKLVRLADLKGKVVLVEFWATWCTPCVASFPTFRQLSRTTRIGASSSWESISTTSPNRNQANPGARPFPPSLISGRSWWPSQAGPTL